MAIKFFDAFTDADGVTLDNHLADFPVGEGWLGFPGSAHLLKILGNNVVDGWAGVNSYWANTNGLGGGIAYAIGDEITCDIRRWSTNIDNGFGFLADNNTQILVVYLQGEDAINCTIGTARKDGLGTHDEISGAQPTMPRVPCADGAWVRFGVKILSAITFQFFWEPAGGGPRTVLYLDDTFAGTLNGVWNVTDDYFDAAHDRVGLWTQYAAGANVNLMNRDNLQVADSSTVWVPVDPPMGSTSWGDC